MRTSPTKVVILLRNKLSDSIFCYKFCTFEKIICFKMKNRFADIVLPLAQPAYCFALPEGVALQRGDAVAVQFGPRNIYTGIV